MELILASEIGKAIHADKWGEMGTIRAVLIELARRGVLEAVVLVPEGKPFLDGDMAFKVLAK